MKVIKTYRIKGLEKKRKTAKDFCQRFKDFFSNWGNYKREKIHFFK